MGRTLCSVRPPFDIDEGNVSMQQVIIYNSFKTTLKYLFVVGFYQCAKYEFASSNTAQTTLAFDACFVWKLAPLADERNGYFHTITYARNKRITLQSTYQILVF
jgi:hypothetical protein